MTFAASFVRIAAFGAIIACGVAGASAETGKKDKAKESSAKPALVGSYGDWKVYQSAAGKNHICYLLGQPKSREPEEMKRDPGFAFISERPAERVRNEVSFIVGFEVAGSGPSEPKQKDKDRPKKRDKRDKGDDKPETALSPTATIDEAEFELMPKGADLWVKNPAEESKVIDQMRKGDMLVIKAASKRGKVAKDSYSLTGFSQAIDRALKDCPGG